MASHTGRKSFLIRPGCGKIIYVLELESGQIQLHITSTIYGTVFNHRRFVYIIVL